MSEEEILNIMNKLGNIYDELKKDDEEGHSSAYEMQFEDFEAIQGLLDLYCSKTEQLETAMNSLKEEKEQNTVQRKMLNDAFDRGWIHKDKIREKIKEYQDFFVKNPEAFRKGNCRVIICILKELLEEE